MNDHYRDAEKMLGFYDGIPPGDSREALALAKAQVYATLAAAPRPWLRCLDKIHGTGTYLLNPAHVVYIERHEDGWWQAFDAITGRSHQILSDDDAKVEALGGQP